MNELDRLQLVATSANGHARRVFNGNMGALNVVMRLQHRTRWAEMMEWLDENGYHGSLLWVLYKDLFHESLFDLGDFITYMINSQHWRERHGNCRPNTT